MSIIIKWGMIGCGDVAERKSGPAFAKAEHSQLLAVMRRNGKKAEAYAKRHNVPHWYDDTEKLFAHPEINAIYIATPPSTHLKYALRAIELGKNVYLEKPMALNLEEAEQIKEALAKSNIKLTIAHYRRRLPAFLKVKELLDAKVLGDIRFVDLKILQSKESGIIADTEDNWRLDPEVSGGGYFFDIAPHQIDLMIHYFGKVEKAFGLAASHDPEHQVNDLVQGIIAFENGVQFRGIWCFDVAEGDTEDLTVIYGEKGSIKFSFYANAVHIDVNDKRQSFDFKNPEYVEQPLIEATVDYFRGVGKNPCPVEEGVAGMEIMRDFSS